MNSFCCTCLLQDGRLVLPDVTVTDSSEALLSGRKPPFRLVARAKHPDGRRLRMRHAVSEPFVVATRRVRASHKVGGLQESMPLCSDSMIAGHCLRRVSGLLARMML
jgi:hypothetical protein